MYHIGGYVGTACTYGDQTTYTEHPYREYDRQLLLTLCKLPAAQTVYRSVISGVLQSPADASAGKPGSGRVLEVPRSRNGVACQRETLPGRPTAHTGRQGSVSHTGEPGHRFSGDPGGIITLRRRRQKTEAEISANKDNVVGSGTIAVCPSALGNMSQVS